MKDVTVTGCRKKTESPDNERNKGEIERNKSAINNSNTQSTLKIL